LRLCNIPLPTETLQRYELSGGPEVDLLEDIAPSVLLLGTSFSSEAFSFEYFLKAASGLDVVSLATDGGSKWYSFERLFMNEDTPLPTILLWEFPAMDIKTWEIPYLKRLIPMVYGPCKPELTLQKQEKIISATDTILIDNPDNLAISGSNYFVQLEFPDVTIRDFLVNFVYTDGSSDFVRVRRDNRIENNGRFQIELSNTVTSTLSRIELLGSEYKGSIRTSLCSIY
jgi:hypothetical protein